ncbi:flagellar basal body P-ring formation chaperone FlgA [Aestuariibacter sp. AA17]|uniref:Flagella basal body P-ring formation protein FlgA n=1 Tax=Fluctibacter corallii TaxID=2984329 RepID=A0ABT3A9H9_9ALTE|nr:flagellar basal body P-ring formation chaperone FlgA [Aestuariibacter sp. AA17]MCV2885321.1 flagellar basal body P-ring formation chaperone FlgA [Aestuariibacter sp. AA17]
MKNAFILLSVLAGFTSNNVMGKSMTTYLPLTLKDVAPAIQGDVKNRVLLDIETKGWLDLTSVLTEEELNAANLPYKRIWVNACHQADEQKLKENILAWIARQPWASALSVNAVEVTSRQVCENWNKTRNFALKHAQILKRDNVLTSADKQGEQLNITLHANVEVLVASQNISVGDAISNANVAFQSVPLTQISVRDLNTVMPFNQIAKRAIASGATLRSTWLEGAPAVSAGDNVSATLENGQIEITARAKSLGSGKVGENIMVLIQGTNSPIQATITKKGHVNVGE